MNREVEDGFGCAGLVPTKAEREEERREIKSAAQRMEAALALESMKRQRDELAEALRAIAAMDPEHMTGWSKRARVALAGVRTP